MFAADMADTEAEAQRLEAQRAAERVRKAVADERARDVLHKGALK